MVYGSIWSKRYVKVILPYPLHGETIFASIAKEDNWSIIQANVSLTLTPDDYVPLAMFGN